MSAELQPFESHPASPGDLQAGADNLVQQGAEALQNADQTEQAYSPALDAVTGEPGPAVAQASDPVKAKSLAGSESLVWAGVATRYWSQKVRTFNQQVEIIKVDRFNAMKAADDAAATSTLPPAEATQQADDAKAAADAAARERWYRVYNEEIVSGRSVVQTWLSRGPTEEYMQVARDVGAMPDLRWGPLEALWKGVLGIGGNDVSGIPPLSPGGTGRGGRRGRLPSRGGDSISDAIRLSHQLKARELASGHAYDKHVLYMGEFPHVRTREQFAELIEDVMVNGERKLGGAGREAYWLEREGTIVIINPADADGGTAFRPKEGRRYLDVSFQ